MVDANTVKIARLICYRQCRAGLCKDNEQCYHPYPGEGDPCFMDYIKQAEQMRARPLPEEAVELIKRLLTMLRK